MYIWVDFPRMGNEAFECHQTSDSHPGETDPYIAIEKIQNLKVLLFLVENNECKEIPATLK